MHHNRSQQQIAIVRTNSTRTYRLIKLSTTKGFRHVRWSQSLIPTLKEDPADAEVPSHKLMLRAGLVRQLMAGAYTYLPLGLRAIQKASDIIREEMETADAVEIFMPAMQPIELFERTGREEAFGNVLVKFKIQRGDKQLGMALGPTHEEVCTDLISKQIQTYRQLPLTVYQIQTKFRNEERPRFGVLRTSEFLMKDAYSFSSSLEQLDDAYQKMYDAYCRIFARCGLEAIPVEAESGPIGGDASHEFMIPAENGEDQIVRCASCGYGANLERADTGRKPVDISSISSEGHAPEKIHTPNAGSIDAVAEMIGIYSKEMIKTLIFIADDKPVAVLLRGDHDANEGKIRRALGATNLEIADEATIEKVTGAPVGFAGPMGIGCDIIADHDVAMIESAVTGANEKDQHYKNIRIGRDYQIDTTHDLRDATSGDPCPRCNDGTVDFVHGIEVGHVFKLGTKYSESLNAEYLDENDTKHPIIMGCYGIGINRIIAGLAETKHDDKGLIWPMSVAPFEVLVIPLNIKDEEVMKVANDLYADLRKAGIDTLIDDRKQRPGVKFNDADLIGIPLRVVVGGRGLKEGALEIKWRTSEDAESISLANAAEEVVKLVETERAKFQRNEEE